MAEPGAPPDKVRIFVDGAARLVRKSSTILDALRVAGHAYLAGCGCRRGDCRECTILVRAPGDARPAPVLACQTPVRPDIRISKIPFQWNRAFANRQR